jgi:hypothetical protein
MQLSLALQVVEAQEFISLTNFAALKQILFIHVKQSPSLAPNSGPFIRSPSSRRGGPS